MNFFKKASDKELFNFKRGLIFGFFIYMLVAAVNYFYYLITEYSLFSPTFIFWSGLIASTVLEYILNIKEKFVRNRIDI